MRHRELTVGIDDQIFRRQPWGGISRIFVEMTKVWRDPELGIKPRPLFRVARSDLVAGAFPGVRVLDLPDNPLGARAFAILNHQSRRSINYCDVLQHTYFDGRCLTPTDKPRISHIYDMIDETSGSTSPRWFAKRAFTEASDVVICISESTRSALLATWPIDPDKVKTVLLAATPALGTPVPRYPGGPDRYLLYVGNRGSYKDFRTLVEAWGGTPALNNDPELFLIAVGGGAFTPAEGELLSAAGLRHRTRQVDASDSELAAFYQHATVVVQTSRAEGFGLPVLEAMAAGAPAVAAELPVVREVGEDAVSYFVAGDATSLGSVLEELVQSPTLRAEMRRRGRHRAKAFSWTKTASQTAVHYAEAIERHRVL